MKTVFDAVNELKGRMAGMMFSNADEFLFFNNSLRSYVTDTRVDTCNGRYQLVCTTKEFNQCVAEMSDWQPSIPTETPEEKEVFDRMSSGKTNIPQHSPIVDIPEIMHPIGHCANMTPPQDFTVKPTFTQADADAGKLPEVGSKVLYTTTESQIGKPSIEVGVWYHGTVIAYHDGAVWTSDNGLRLLKVTKFKPIPTERDKAIESIARILSDDYVDVTEIVKPLECFMSQAKRLYDAGYRKESK